MKEKTKRIVSFIGAIIILIAVPVVLNYTLPLSLDFKIIGENGNKPATWLVFWGTYAAAMGTFLVILQNYFTQKRLREDQVRLRQDQINLLKREQRERHLEEFKNVLLELFSFYSIDHFQFLSLCKSWEEIIKQLFETQDKGERIIMKLNLIEELYYHNHPLIIPFSKVTDKCSSEFQNLLLIAQYSQFLVVDIRKTNNPVQATNEKIISEEEQIKDYTLLENKEQVERHIIIRNLYKSYLAQITQRNANPEDIIMNEIRKYIEKSKLIDIRKSLWESGFAFINHEQNEINNMIE